MCFGLNIRYKFFRNAQSSKNCTYNRRALKKDERQVYLKLIVLWKYNIVVLVRKNSGVTPSRLRDCFDLILNQNYAIGNRNNSLSVYSVFMDCFLLIFYMRLLLLYLTNI